MEALGRTTGHAGAVCDNWMWRLVALGAAKLAGREALQREIGGAGRRGQYIGAVSFEEAAGFVARDSQGSQVTLYF